MAKTKYTTVRVEVTAADIRRGARGDPYHCAVALAAKRAVRAAKCGVRVEHYGGGPWLGVQKGWHYVSIKVPETARRFAAKFDDAAVPTSLLKPFSFTLRLPN